MRLAGIPAPKTPGLAAHPAAFESIRALNETLKPLRDPRLDQADMLCDLIKDIRRILVHPDLQNHVKLAAIAEAVDELAPPPGPGALCSCRQLA